MEERGKPSTRETTLVLVGRTGNGKSATGNSILLTRSAFKSKGWLKPVTTTSELQQVEMKDGRILKVIDTPGLFDPTVKLEVLSKEIVRCIELAKEGIHGILLVLSLSKRFTTEEAAAIDILQKLFGEKILNYVVVIFTCGDELENEETLDDRLIDSPPELLDLLRLCNNRKVLFDNKTTSVTLKQTQRVELLKQIDILMIQNRGRPYSNEMFRKAQDMEKQKEKEAAQELEKKIAQEVKEKVGNTNGTEAGKTDDTCGCVIM